MNPDYIPFPTTDNQNMSTPTIETERLILRKWHLNDAEALFKYASDKRVSELALWPCHTSVEMSRDVIEHVFATNPYSFAMVLKETNEPIGCIGLVPPDSEHYSLADCEMEVGYWIGHKYWGKGLTTEALGSIIEYCRQKLNLKSLVITTDARNFPSQRVAEKCNFRFIEKYTLDGIASNAYRLTLM